MTTESDDQIMARILENASYFATRRRSSAGQGAELDQSEKDRLAAEIRRIIGTFEQVDLNTRAEPSNRTGISVPLMDDGLPAPTRFVRRRASNMQRG